MEHFSERETKIINILGRKKLTIEQISNELFKKCVNPLDHTIVISNSVRRIIKKCDHYNLTWTLIKNRENQKLVIRKENKKCLK